MSSAYQSFYSRFSSPFLPHQVRLHLQQFYAMFLKRALYSWRNWKVIVAQFLVPLVFTIVALVVAHTFPNHQDAPQLRLALSRYGPTRVPVALQPGAGPLASALANTYRSQLSDQLGQLINISGKHTETNRTWCDCSTGYLLKHMFSFFCSHQTLLITSLLRQRKRAAASMSTV